MKSNIQKVYSKLPKQEVKLSAHKIELALIDGLERDIDKIYEDIPEMIERGDQMLFIDADASDGFWDRIGMIESQRYGYGRNPKYANREGAGYEKYITLHNLHKYSLS